MGGWSTSSCRSVMASRWPACSRRVDGGGLMIRRCRSIGAYESFVITRTAVDDHLDIARPDQLRAVADATRWRMLGKLLEGPATVQEVARALRIAKGTAAHHMRVMDAAGLVRVADTKRIRGVVEKRAARV